MVAGGHVGADTVEVSDQAKRGDSTPIADPRAYFQVRVALYAKSLGAFFLALGLIDLCGTIFTPVPGEKLLNVSRFIVVSLVGLYCGVWLYSRRGTRSNTALRALEITTAIGTSTAFTVVMFNPPQPGIGVILLSITVMAQGCVLMLRAAVVPSRARTTLLVGIGCTLILMVGANHAWDFFPASLPQNIDRRFLGAIHSALLLSGFVVVSTITSKVTHRLQSKVREAMQLGQYTLEEKIGEGGMGVVYLARHALLRRPTAVKLLPADKAGAQAVARFEREVQQTSRLTHPNTVAIYDFGHTADGVFYYAMEYLEGIALDELVQIDGPQPVERVVHIVAQAADALAEAHRFDLVHRDVKPANIVLCTRGDVPDVVKVLDFGLVKDITAPKDSALTAATTLTGPPLYMAPESLADPETIDPRADIYALGAVAYFLLTGQPVFEGKTVVEICGHHLHTAPTPPSEILGKPLGDIEKVVLACLSKSPGERPQRAGDLRAALLACSKQQWSREQADVWWNDNYETIAAHRRTQHDQVNPYGSTMAVDGLERA